MRNGKKGANVHQFSRKSLGMTKRGDEGIVSFKKVSWDGKKGQ